MVINDKGLLRAMKEAHKSTGYEICCRKSGEFKEICIETSRWHIVCEAKTVSRKILGLIVEHLGEVPQVGQCYQIKKKESQVKIMEPGKPPFGGITPDDCVTPDGAYKTSLVWKHANVWKCAETGKVLWIDPETEEILNFQGKAYCLGGKVLHMSDTVSAVSILPENPVKEEDIKMLNNLARILF